MPDTETTSTDTLRIEIAFAWPDRQWVETVSMPVGSTVLEAIQASRILAIIHERDPAYEVRPDRVGVFSRRVRLEDEIHEGDRIELYRPLQADPKEARRARVEAERQDGLRDGSRDGVGRKR